jgi:hypothetical protein
LRSATAKAVGFLAVALVSSRQTGALLALTLLAALTLLTLLTTLALLPGLLALALLTLTLLALSLLTLALLTLALLTLALLTLAGLLALLTLLSLALLALFARLLAGAALISGSVPKAGGLFQAAAQVFQLRQLAIQTLAGAVAFRILAVGLADSVAELLERTGHGVFAAGDVGSAALADVFGRNPQTRRYLVLLQFDQGLAHPAGRLALLVAQAPDGLLQLALEGFQFLMHGLFLVGQIRFLLAGEAAGQASAAAARVLAAGARFFEGAAQGVLDFRRDLVLLLGKL